MPRLLVLSILVLLPGLLSAQTIYRSVDAKGNIIFSDTPTEGSEEVTIKETQIIHLPSVSNPESSRPGSATGDPMPYQYSGLKISSPANDEAIRDNAGNITVLVEVSPQLVASHTLTLYLDGEEHASSTSPSFNLTNLSRGTHQARVVIRDAAGKIQSSSPTTTFHLLRASVNRPGT